MNIVNLEPTRVRLYTWNDARDALRHRDLRQGLYDEGKALMDDVIVNLHGPAHLARRRLENKLFRRDTFVSWERELIPRLINDTLNNLVDTADSGDLVTIARRTMMRLSALVAGVDIGFDLESFNHMSALMSRLSAASTVVHATGDKNSIIKDGNEALREFVDVFLAPARLRREALIEAVGNGDLASDQLPSDVLTLLLSNQDNLSLPNDVIAREIAYFPWVGSHSTSAALVHALHHCFTWSSNHPDTLVELSHNASMLQNFVHESLRLHPASPESSRIALSDITLPSGAIIPHNARVAIDMVEANRDVEIFGERSHEFDPFRIIPQGIPRWGLTFGTGFHACLGQELAGGLGVEQQQASGELFGAITVMIQAILQRGGRPHPTREAKMDTTTKRPMWSTYPITFETPAT